MFKLLTEEGLRKAYGEYKLRRRTVILIAITLVLLAGNIGTLPSYVSSIAREQEVRERVRISESNKLQGDERALLEWLARTNSILQVVSPELDTLKPSLLVDKVVASKLSGIHLMGFALEKTNDAQTISVDGIADSRQALISFRDRLGASGHFVSVDLPISDLALDKNIDFQIKLVPSIE